MNEINYLRNNGGKRIKILDMTFSPKILSYILLVPFLLFSLSQESFTLTIKFFPPFWESGHQVGGIKPSPPVALTWQLFAYFMEQALVCTSAQPSHNLPGRMQQPRWCTLWSPPCWTPSSTAWGTGTSRGLYKKSLEEHSVFSDGNTDPRVLSWQW